MSIQDNLYGRRQSDLQALHSPEREKAKHAIENGLFYASLIDDTNLSDRLSTTLRTALDALN